MNRARGSSGVELEVSGFKGEALQARRVLAPGLPSEFPDPSRQLPAERRLKPAKPSLLTLSATPRAVVRVPLGSVSGRRCPHRLRKCPGMATMSRPDQNLSLCQLDSRAPWLLLRPPPGPSGHASRARSRRNAAHGDSPRWSGAEPWVIPCHDTSPQRGER